jgi:tRNA G46 methylase TrmB
LQHHICKLTLDGKSHPAPIKVDIKNVLDIGTGTGIWAIEFGSEFPSAAIVGIDLSPVSPLQFVPPFLSEKKLYFVAKLSSVKVL